MAIDVNDLNFQKEVLDSDLPVLVDFWAPWCGPCQMVGPALEEIAKDYEGKIKVCKMDVDDSPNIASNYGVMSIPTLIVFKSGKPVKKAIGAQPKSGLESLINTFV
ncbi:MAG: thioredoxin [Candidatus Omnitrophica bacterium]|nr:thioredoxin [Candidatus Omnitrophota bacterium]